MDESKKLILVVEDDLEICTLYKFLFERDGYTIRESHTGREALVQLGLEVPEAGSVYERLLPVLPDLVILDIMLPEVDGYSIFSKMIQNKNLMNIPVIIVSAKSRMGDIFMSSSSVKGFFSKPFDPKALKAKVKELVG